MSRMTLSIIAQFQDRASRGLKTLLRLGRQQERMQKAYGRATQDAARAQQRLARSSSEAGRAMGNESAAASRLRAALARVNAMIRQQVSLRERLRRAGSLAREGAGRIGRAGAYAAGIYASVQASAASAASLVVGPAAQVEGYMVQLEALEGSAAKAKAAMDWIVQFAQKTPLELHQVIDAYAQLRTFGLDPTNGTMQALVDTMAMSGKGAEHLQGIILAVGQAWTKGKLQGEEALQLIERGVPVWDLLSKAMGKPVPVIQKLASKGKLGRDVIAQLIQLMGQRAAGASEKYSRTWTGMVSNMADMWFKFRLMVAHSGVFDFLKEKLRWLLNTFTRLEQAGKLQQIAQQIGDSIVQGLKAVWQFGLGVWAVLQRVGAALSWAAEKLGGWNNLAMLLMALPLTNLFVSAASGVLMLGRALMLVAANPMTLLIAGLVAAAAALVDWPALIEAARGAWARLTAALGNFDLSAMLARTRAALSALGGWLVGWGRSLLGGIAGTMNWLGPVSERLGRAWGSLSRAGQQLASAFSALDGGGGLQRLAGVLGRLMGLGIGALAWALEQLARGIELLATGIAAVLRHGAAFVAWLTSLPQRIAAAWQAFKQWLSQPFDPFPRLRQQVAEIIRHIQRLPQQAQRVIAQLQQAFANIDLLDAGKRALQSFWNGMKSAMKGLASWARRKLASIFTLPSWAKGFFSGSKQPAAQPQPQARASGGPFGRGPLLVGERGPELIYASHAGWVAHNDNLRRLHDMARRTAASLAAVGLAGQVALAQPQIAPVSPSPAAIAAAPARAGQAQRTGETRIEVRYAPQITVNGNADPAAIRQALDAHLDDLLERLERRQRERARLEF